MTEPTPDYSLALAEARRSFDGLLQEVSLLRQRATQVLGVASLSTSFLGVSVLSGGQVVGIRALVALLAFLVTVLLCLVLLLPKKVIASINPATLVLWAEVPEITTPQMERQLAFDYGESFETNRARVDRQQWIYTAAVVSLVVLVMCLVLSGWSA